MYSISLFRMQAVCCVLFSLLVLTACCTTPRGESSSIGMECFSDISWIFSGMAGSYCRISFRWGLFLILLKVTSFIIFQPKSCSCIHHNFSNDKIWSQYPHITIYIPIFTNLVNSGAFAFSIRKIVTWSDLISWLILSCKFRRVCVYHTAEMYL